MCDIEYKQYYDITKYNTSLEFDSGTVLCKLTSGDMISTVEVCDELKIRYKDEVYIDASRYPKELMEAIHNNEEDKYEVLEANSFYCFCSCGEGTEEDGYAVETDIKCANDLFNLCVDALAWYGGVRK